MCPGTVKGDGYGLEWTHDGGDGFMKDDQEKKRKKIKKNRKKNEIVSSQS